MTHSLQIHVDAATLKSLAGKEPAEDSDPPEADLVFVAEVADDMRHMLARMGKSFGLALLGADVKEGEKPLTYSLAGAKLKGLSGKEGSDMASAPLVNLKLRVDVTPTVQTLLGLLGKAWHLTFTPEVEQLGMFVADGKADEAGADEPARHDAEPLADAEPEPGVPLTNGNGAHHAADDFTTSDPPPPKLDEITTHRVRRRAAAAIADSEVES